MIANGYNHQTIQFQPPQPLQNIKQTQPQASPEDIERTNERTLNFQNQLLKKNIVSTLECNRLIIPIGIYKSIISVHCPSVERYKWLPGVCRETFEKYPADIYLCYYSDTPQPQGFAMRNQLFLTKAVPNKHEYGAPLYSIEREKLDRKISKLFDLDYLLRNSQPEPISYV